MRKPLSRRTVLLKVVMPIAVTFLVAIVFGVVYTQLWPERANRPDDQVGNWLASLGIPAVWIGTYALAFRLDRPAADHTSEPRSEDAKGTP